MRSKSRLPRFLYSSVRVVIGPGHVAWAIIVLDVPAGATLSPAAHDPVIDAWVVRPRQLAELSVLPAKGHNQDFTLSLFGVCLQSGSRAGPHLLAQIPVSVG